MNKIQAKRLLNVARALDESKEPKKFSMETYLNDDGDRVSNRWCGTPACALGHYAVRKDLQKFLRPGINREYNVPCLRYARSGRETGWDLPGVQRHFGISYEEAEELFDFSGCGYASTPKEASRYIKRFVAKKLKEQTK